MSHRSVSSNPRYARAIHHANTPGWLWGFPLCTLPRRSRTIRGMLPILLLAAAGTLIPALTMWLADQRARGQN
jgi:hypothetical protein